MYSSSWSLCSEPTGHSRWSADLDSTASRRTGCAGRQTVSRKPATVSRTGSHTHEGPGGAGNCSHRPDTNLALYPRQVRAASPSGDARREGIACPTAHRGCLDRMDWVGRRRTWPASAVHHRLAHTPRSIGASEPKDASPRDVRPRAPGENPRCQTSRSSSRLPVQSCEGFGGVWRTCHRLAEESTTSALHVDAPTEGNTCAGRPNLFGRWAWRTPTSWGVPEALSKEGENW